MMDSRRDVSMLIGSGRVVSDDWLEVINPYGGACWARVPQATPEHIDGAVRAARVAFDDGPWGESLPAVRARLMRSFADVIEQNADELARLQVMENGKAIREQSAQTQGLAGYLRYFAGLAETYGGRTIPISVRDTHAYTVREPYGVVAALTPWNSPLALLMWKLAPALAAGNVMVVKPSEVTPVSTIRLAELALEAGLPDGVLNVVTGDGAVGAALVEHPGIDRIAFTGSTAVGQQIARTAGARLIPVSLELGGKSPNIVFADADLDAAVEGVVGGIFAAAGQTCIAGSRVLVARAVASEFTDRLVARTARIRLGDPLDWNTEVGTIACRRQFDKVSDYLDIGRAEGARLAAGGGRPDDAALADGLFISPSIFVDVSPDMRIAREEIFGPVVVVMPFDSDDEAIRIANASQYGLAAGVWTRDLRLVHRMASALKAGTVWVNTYRKTNYAAPFGGYKSSGVGRESGPDALDEYTQEKLVWIDVGSGIADPFNPFG